MLDKIKVEFTSSLLIFDFTSPVEDAPQPMSMELSYQHQELDSSPAGNESHSGAVANDGVLESKKPFVRDQPKVGRNDPCTCGSGKKFKQCCGKL